MESYSPTTPESAATTCESFSKDENDTPRGGGKRNGAAVNLLLSRADVSPADKLIGRCLGNGHGVIVDTRKDSVLYAFAELIDDTFSKYKRNLDVHAAEVDAKCATLASRLRSSSHDLTDHVSTFEELADVLVQDRRATDAALSHHHARMGRIECAAIEADHQIHAKLYNIITHLHEVDRVAAADRAECAVESKRLDSLKTEIAALRAHARRTLDIESAVAGVLRTGFILLLFAILAVFIDHEFARA